MTQHKSSTADFDLTQFYEIFFEEAKENLDQMEQMLINMDVQLADNEYLNGVFRCAHSVKGGAATFGFNDVSELTHCMESLLDKVRHHEIKLQPNMVDVLLESADVARTLLANHQSGEKNESVDISDLVNRINILALLDNNSTNQKPDQTTDSNIVTESSATISSSVATEENHIKITEQASPNQNNKSNARSLHVFIGPMENPDIADSLLDLFRDIPGLGTAQKIASKEGCREFSIVTNSSDEELLDLFEFYVARQYIHITVDSNQDIAGQADKVKQIQSPQLDDNKNLPNNSANAIFSNLDNAQTQNNNADIALNSSVTRSNAPASALESNSIRVAVSKIDQIINLVGELVITQAMLEQNSNSLDPSKNQQLFAGLANLNRNTRDLQEAVMSIRMIPMSFVFSRFPRLVRDLASKTGKKIELVTSGEATELDKSLIEKITDPLMHLVRNSCDHGIEFPADRISAGKPEYGTLTLAASHQGSSVVIEVRDDGKGLSRENIINRARERGMEIKDNMSDQEVWRLIFAPGFSTAKEITDISGRGVGMDVVIKNIDSLSGTVDIESQEGKGMIVKVRLPLTLAIMDGMSVRVGEEVYVLPLSSVVESFKPQNNTLDMISKNSRLIKVREEYLPVVFLAQLFDVPLKGLEHSPNSSDNIIIIVESEGVRIALLVNELLGQQQVVVKNLETNYRANLAISGATIMGDGRVALIIDVAGLVRQSK